MAILTLTTNNAAYGNVTGAGTYDAGTSITINATANDGYSFMAWLDSEGRVVWGAEKYTLTINEDTTLQAVFMSNVSNVDIYGFCGANCRHKVLSAGQTMHLVQEMIANGGQIPTGFVNTTAVNEIMEQNTGTSIKLWVGTQAEWDNWKGDKSKTFSIISDDNKYETLLSRINELENIADGISKGNLIVPYANIALNATYDLVIKTQLEFENWYSSLDAGTCTAKSVLLVGDGGNLQYTRSDGLGLHLPETLYRLDGINNAIINISNFSYDISTNKGGVWYSTSPTYNNYHFSPTISRYSINDLRLVIDGVSDGFIDGFVNCAYLTNCTVASSTNVDDSVGFYNCTHLINCMALSSGGSSSSGIISAFQRCIYLTNCTGISNTDSGNGTSIGVYECEQLINCRGTATGGAVSIGFHQSKYLTNCIGSGTGFLSGMGFDTCHYMSCCSGSGSVTSSGSGVAVSERCGNFDSDTVS